MRRAHGRSMLCAFSFARRRQETRPMAPRQTVSPHDVFTLSDLRDWPTNHTWLAVLGHPIKHSISPAMHNAALAALTKSDSRYSTWRYVRFDIPPEQLPDALQEFHAFGFRGLNLTVPHKVIAFDRVHAVDTAARPIGAVNTLRWSAAGWEGFNTDGYGLATALREELGATLAGSHVVLLGAGGAARGAAVECIQQGCATLWIANRTPANRDSLTASLPKPAPGTIVRGFDPLAPPTELPAGAWIINATSAGLREGDAAPIELARLPRPAGVYDMIYNPPQTPLLQTAETLGLRNANGLSMLIHQGARALQLWTGSSVPVEEMRRGAEAAMRR